MVRFQPRLWEFSPVLEHPVIRAVISTLRSMSRF
jgi:hypothetical protein